ncbi:MAG: TerB family tellurite resistance protein [Hyphomicrobiales bacterium]|nr:TerB family tellurite resistance protein [Hyphomicrobiales bacterium]
MKLLQDTLSRWFGSAPAPLDNPDNSRVAAAALLVHASVIDGAVTETEADRLRELLMQRFSLTQEETNALIIAAERSEAEAVDLYGFTSKIKQAMSEEERQGLVFMMWEMAYADGRLDPLEDNLIWRASELLGVSTRDRMIMKKRALGEM